MGLSPGVCASGPADKDEVFYIIGVGLDRRQALSSPSVCQNTSDYEGVLRFITDSLGRRHILPKKQRRESLIHA